MPDTAQQTPALQPSDLDLLYENWYLKVLFHVLKFSDKTKLVFGLPEGRSVQMNASTADFFHNHTKLKEFCVR